MGRVLASGKNNQEQNADVSSEILGSLSQYLCEGIFRASPSQGVMFANRALMEMFGYTSLEEFQSVSLDSLLGDQEARAYLLDKIRAEGLVAAHRILCRKKNGRTFWGLLTCKLERRKEATVFEGSLLEITDRVMMEEQLREARLVAEKAQTELDRFIYSASHDIRSPISSIQGLINIMKIEFQDIHSTHLIDLMAVSISRLERFVLGLTTFAQNSKREVRVTEIDFERMVGVILNRLVDLPSFYKISVSSEIVEGASFFADRFRLRVALSAVIKNSFDFSDLRKANPFVSIKITTHAENAVIEILDNGVGIASTHQARVFEMFYRGSDLSTGSGIGLYTARDAVVRLGGNISLNSEYGIGTSVRIVIPNTIKGRLSVKKKSMKSSPSNESTRVA